MPLHRSRLLRLLPLISFAAALPVAAMDIILPTVNRALFAGNYQAFFMYVPRSIGEQTYNVWQGGQFGFVRSPVASAGEILYMRLHEGVDIKPVERDATGNPLDLVWAIADGIVVHVNPTAAFSNYGKYVVVEHDWEEGKFYSLYAHLMKAEVKINDIVRAGTILGKLGYTGDGINKERAHVHLELNMMLHRDFERWFGISEGAQPHKLYHGFNLVGLNIASLYLANHGNRALRLRDFIASQEACYKVLVPKEGSRLDILTRHPWLLQTDSPEAPSWEITFHATGFPLAVQGVDQTVVHPQLSWIKPSPHPCAYLTARRVTGTANNAKLSPTGMKFINLVSGRFPAALPPPMPVVAPDTGSN